ncbi:carbohydrate ABC transporter permease [Eisenbergiella porci]|uniref:carbohydrate ABC transporter permease n=1 Tax=Eisenbergiella porci TaxID=2652274 RepID=UPI002A80742C|nr:carbohydrate ABC transporter permease [Eisenbergiella porci]
MKNVEKSRNRRQKQVSLAGQTKAGKVGTWLILLFICLISLIPLLWVGISTLKADPLAEPGLTLPGALCFKGYVTVFRDMHILRYFFNSFKVAGISVFLSILMISMSAYVVARMEFKLKALVSALLMSTLFIPATAMTFPVYNLVNSLKINDRHAGIMTAAILAFMNYWNEYYWASMVLTTKELKTVPAILAQFTTAFSTNYNGLFPAIVVILIPPVVIYCCCSKFFIEALSGGAVKG